MKKTHILLIIIIAVLLGFMITNLMSETRTYATFKEASKNIDKNYDIVGVIDTSKSIDYNAIENTDQFSFYMIDADKTSFKVIVAKAKPQDFEKSTQVVVSGKAKENIFEANNILMKCPSKYKSNNIDSIKKI